MHQYSGPVCGNLIEKFWLCDSPWLILNERKFILQQFKENPWKMNECWCYEPNHSNKEHRGSAWYLHVKKLIWISGCQTCIWLINLNQRITSQYALADIQFVYDFIKSKVKDKLSPLVLLVQIYFNNSIFSWFMLVY